MLGELLAFGFGALFTMVVGIPLAVRLAQVHVWRRVALPDARDKVAPPVRTPFEPVDFGPDLLRWPSEVPRVDTRIPEPPWPSARWDDPHFGKAARALAATAPVDDGRSGRPDRQRAERKPERPRAEKRPERPRAAERPPAQAETPPREAKRKPKKEAPPPPVAPAQPAARPAAPPARDGLPGPDQLEAMIAELGLAGTVQALMKQNGWDFKEAAGWLARARKR